jgi:hypothetical protein
MLEGIRQSRAGNEFDNDARLVDGAIAIFGAAFELAIKAIALDPRAWRRGSLFLSGTNMPTVGRNVRCNPKQY